MGGQTNYESERDKWRVRESEENVLAFKRGCYSSGRAVLVS